jgi:hypothetical protein
MEMKSILKRTWVLLFLLFYGCPQVDYLFKPIASNNNYQIKDNKIYWNYEEVEVCLSGLANAWGDSIAITDGIFFDLEINNKKNLLFDLSNIYLVDSRGKKYYPKLYKNEDSNKNLILIGNGKNTIELVFYKGTEKQIIYPPIKLFLGILNGKDIDIDLGWIKLDRKY